KQLLSMYSCSHKPTLTKKEFFSFESLRIRIKPVFLLLLCVCLVIVLSAQQKITGIVNSASGSPLLGATITIKGSNIGTSTNADGSFSIIAKPGDVLMISFVGYYPKLVKVGTDTDLKIFLAPSINDLDQVVVTGYTSQKIKEISGSVAVVNPTELTAIPAGQVEQMLQGRVAGLTVMSSGEPGAAANVRLHGIGNFGDVTPLYIVDGLEMQNIDNINPYDIESLQVLKDAGTYSIYGVRGANGVIVITTKKGKNGKTKIDYNFYVGLQEPLKKGLDLLPPQEQANLVWIALKNSHDTAGNGYPSDPLYGNGPTPVLPDYIFPYGAHNGDPGTDPASYNNDPTLNNFNPIARFNKTGTDWFHALFKPAISQNHTITVSGGNNNNQYLFSFGYLDQQGTFLNDYLKRYTLRINNEFSVLNTIRIGENLQLNYNQNPKLWNNGQGFLTLTADPSLPIYDIKGNIFSGVFGLTSQNPVQQASLLKNDNQNNWEAFGNAYAEIDFLKKFSFRTSFGGTLDYHYGYNYSFAAYVPSTSLYNSSFSENSGYFKSGTWTNTLNFSTSFLKDNHIKILAVTEQRSNYNREVGGTRINSYINDPRYFTLTAGNPTGQTNYSVASGSYLYSFMGHAEYNYREKYFLTATLRRDGSSLFAPENRFGWFPSLSAGWRITEENFLKGSKLLADLKLRGSWGKTGFDGNTDPSNQFTLYGGGPGSAYYDINGISTGSIQQGLRLVRIGNASTGWQQDIVTNIGIDAVLWNGKLGITADIYNRNSSGLLLPIALPAYLGVDAIAPNVNVGDLRNTGLDILVSSKGKFSKNWSWDGTLTFTSYRNRIAKLNGLPFLDDVFQNTGGLVRNAVGYPIGSFYGYKIIGFFRDAEDIVKSPQQEAASPGRFKYLDANGDGVINEADEIHFGNPNPKFTLGFNGAINYKNFDFSTFIYGSFGNDVLNSLADITDIFASQPSIKSKTALYNSWTPDHQNAKAPIVENNLNFSNSEVVNSYGLEKGTYVKNKSLMLGYTFTKGWVQKIKIERLRVYVQVVNLFTITNYNGLDPELPVLPPGATAYSSFGIDYGNYPNNEKQYLIGINLNL
ncbi:MAG: SusC/RagA family TonB-linked outer membrane protein, partial [Chitinophagales bacterium]